MNSLLSSIPTAEIQQHNASSSRKPPWFPRLTCLSISCLVLLSSSYLIFHWLSSPSSFSMFLLSASLSLEREGREADTGVSLLGPSAQSPPVQSAPAEATAEVGIQGPGIPHCDEHPGFVFILELYPSHNCGCPAYGVGR